MRLRLLFILAMLLPSVAGLFPSVAFSQSLLPGATASNYTPPAGWRVLSIQGCEGTSNATNEYIGGTCTTTLPHSGTKSLSGTYGGDGHQVRWLGFGNALGVGSEVYVSFWDYLPANARFNEELWIGHFIKRDLPIGPFNGASFQEVIVDWVQGEAGTFNATVARPTLFIQGGYKEGSSYTAEVAPTLGAWVQWEMHFKANTPGASDGWLHLYQNGALFRSWTNQNWNGTANMAGMDIQVGGVYTKNTWRRADLSCGAFIGDGSEIPPACTDFNNCPCQPNVPVFNRFLDDIIVMIPGSGGGSPVGDTTAPSPPTSPAASASGTTVSTTWTVGSDDAGGSGLASTVVLNCIGTACTPTTTVAIVAAPGAAYQATGLTAGTIYGWAFRSADNAGNLSSVTTPIYTTTGTTFRNLTISDDFNRADGLLGASWDDGYTARNAFALVSNQLRVAGIGLDSFETYNATTPANNQWARITFSSLSTADANIKAPGILLRTSAPASVTGYACRVWHWTGGSPISRIERWDSDVSFTPLIDDTTVTWQTGDQLRCEAEGTEIRLYRIRGTAEILVLSATDATYASGRVGLIDYVQAGTTADIQVDDFVAGDISATPPTPPSITGMTVDATGTDLLFGAVTPTTIRVVTGSNTAGIFSSVVEPIANFPGGRYTHTWEAGLDFAGVHPRDAAGVENNNPSDYQYRSLAGIVAPLDVTPPTLTACTPTTDLPFGTTSTVISCVLNKPATARYDTTDAAYGTLANTMTLTSLTVSATVIGLTDGSTTVYYVRAQSTDTFGGLHPMTGSAAITVHVLAAPAADTTAPSTVTNLVCTALSQSQQVCVWTAATDNVAVAGYQVYVATGACSTYNLAGQSVPTTVILLALASDTVHCTKVKAIDTSGNLSAAFSNVSTITTSPFLDFTPPSIMTNLRLISADTTSVVLRSDPGSDDLNSITTTIEVSSAGCGEFVFVYSRLTLEALIPNLTPNTVYCARGKFSDGTNLSLNYSNTVMFMTAVQDGIVRGVCPCRNRQR